MLCRSRLWIWLVIVGQSGWDEGEGTDEVDTRELLQTLDCAAGCETLAEGSTDDLEVGSLSETHFVLMVGLDLSEFSDDDGVVHFHTTETSEGLGGVLVAILLDQEARGFGEDQHADNEDDGPGELDGDGDTVAAGVLAVLCRVVDDGGQEETDCDGELIGADDCTTDPFGRGLGLVEGYCRGQETDPQTGEETPGYEERDGCCDGLENDSEHKDDALHNHAPSSTEFISDRGSEEGTEESSCREEGDNHR